jgi:hypothetical protein
MPIEKQNQSKPRGPDFGRNRAYREQSHCRAKEGEPRIPEGYLQAHNNRRAPTDEMEFSWHLIGGKVGIP